MTETRIIPANARQYGPRSSRAVNAGARTSGRGAPLQGPNAGEIAAMLTDRIDALCADLLPHGKAVRGEWCVGSVQGEPGQSLRVNLGRRAGVWCDFSNGDHRGDALDLVRLVNNLPDQTAAIKWAKGWLGLRDDPQAMEKARHAREKRAEQAKKAEKQDETARNKAKGLILNAEAAIQGTPVDYYLQGARELDIWSLVPHHKAGKGKQLLGALRYRSDVWCSEVQDRLSAMLAFVVHPQTGQFMTCHRTYLQADGRGWDKAALKDPRKAYSGFSGGIIPLWRGASGQPVTKMQPGETLAITEGIEDGLAVAIACPEWRVWAAVSLNNLKNLDLPAVAGGPQSRLILCGDNDDGQAERQALQGAAERFAGQSRRVEIKRPPAAYKDFNDWLRGMARGQVGS